MSAPAQDLPPRLEAAETPAPGVPAPGTVIDRKYRIERQIGQGGMGAVLEALHQQTQQRVAIKWVRPDGSDGRASERLLREARLAGRIEHANVVRVLDVGEAEGSIFLVMELLQGDSLERWVERGPYSPEVATTLMMPVLRGVAAAHRAGVVHRDLKPQNIILCIDPSGPAPHPMNTTTSLRPTVIDFGISRTAPGGDGRGDLALTRTGIMIGTPLYMAPEQLAATTEPDPRSDVYALGVMLYELLSGAIPFEAQTHGLLVAEKLGSEAIPLSEARAGVDPRLERVVMKALEERAGKRYSSVEELARALEPFAQSSFDSPDPYYRGPPLPQRELATERAARPVRRRRRGPVPYLVAGAVVAMMGLAAAIVGLVLLAGDDDVIEATQLPPEPERPTAAPSEPPAPRLDPGAPPRPPVAEVATPPEPAAVEEPTAEVEVPVATPPPATPPRRRARRRSGRLSVSEF